MTNRSATKSIRQLTYLDFSVTNVDYISGLNGSDLVYNCSISTPHRHCLNRQYADVNVRRHENGPVPGPAGIVAFKS